jgi:glycosyltransferase involved in cell wall biosynthesis
VADNGSTDGSQEIASRLRARVVSVPSRGYGSAIRGGVLKAKGKYIIMGDSDDSMTSQPSGRSLTACGKDTTS